MKNNSFHLLLKNLDILTPTQLKELKSHINHKCSIKTIESFTEDITSCPHCESTSFYKWGYRSSLQRYKCKSCNKTFHILSKTPLARLRYKEVWLEYTSDLINSFSIIKSAKLCHISISTAFRWRHKMIKVAELTKSNSLHGIIEMDETYFLKSEKGNHNLKRKSHKRGGWAKRGLSLKEHTPVLIARDRNGNMLDAILRDSQDGSIAKALLEKIAHDDALLCSDSQLSFKSFANMFDFKHETINASKEHARGVFHVQNVNAYTSRLKIWMVHFRGVSTKYFLGDS